MSRLHEVATGIYLLKSYNLESRNLEPCSQVSERCSVELLTGKTKTLGCCVKSSWISDETYLHLAVTSAHYPRTLNRT